MQKNRLMQMLRTGVQAALLSGLTIFSAAPFSCRVTTQGIQLLSGDYTPPALQEHSVVDSRNLQLVFSEEVQLTGVTVSPVMGRENLSGEAAGELGMPASLLDATGTGGALELEAVDCSGNTVRIRLAEEMLVGTSYELYAMVKDAAGNSLTLAVPFTGFNPRIPELMMTEIKPNYKKGTKNEEKERNLFYNEFVELLALSDGNLSGLELVSAYDGEEKAYSFPAVEVKKGEVFVAHLRTAGAGCVSEEGDELDLASSVYTNPQVRDLWSDKTTAVLGDKTDIIIVRNKANGTVMDAVMYREEGVTEWPAKLEWLADQLEGSEFYESASPEFAALSTGITSTKSLQKKGMQELQKLVQGGGSGWSKKGSPGAWTVDTASAGALK